MRAASARERRVGARAASTTHTKRPRAHERRGGVRSGRRRAEARAGLPACQRLQSLLRQPPDAPARPPSPVARGPRPRRESLRKGASEVRVVEAHEGECGLVLAGARRPLLVAAHRQLAPQRVRRRLGLHQVLAPPRLVHVGPRRHEPQLRLDAPLERHRRRRVGAHRVVVVGPRGVEVAGGGVEAGVQRAARRGRQHKLCLRAVRPRPRLHAAAPELAAPPRRHRVRRRPFLQVRLVRSWAGAQLVRVVEARSDPHPRLALVRPRARRVVRRVGAGARLLLVRCPRPPFTPRRHRVCQRRSRLSRIVVAGSRPKPPAVCRLRPSSQRERRRPGLDACHVWVAVGARSGHVAALVNVLHSPMQASCTIHPRLLGVVLRWAWCARTQLRIRVVETPAQRIPRACAWHILFVLACIIMSVSTTTLFPTSRR
eukprot:3906128-Rhodomonas_salina.1